MNKNKLLLYVLAGFFVCFTLNLSAQDTTGETTKQAPKKASKQTSNPSSKQADKLYKDCLLYTSPSPRDATLSRMPSSA